MVPAITFIGCTIVPVISERISFRASFDLPSASEQFESEEVVEALGIQDIQFASANSVNYTSIQKYCSKRKKDPLIKFLKQIENALDDPIDDIKHKLHGLHIMGYKIYLPSFMMKGGSNTCRTGFTSR
jgi:hypothetical protein